MKPKLVPRLGWGADVPVTPSYLGAPAGRLPCLPSTCQRTQAAPLPGMCSSGLCGSVWLHLGGSSPRRRVCTLLVPQRAFAAGPDHDLHRSAVWHSEDGKNQVLYAMGYSEAAKKHE